MTHLRLACLLVGAAGLLNASGLEAPPPIRGSASLKSGETLRYTYHFDHNALTSCVRVGDVLIAMTESGDLLRFDAASLKMTGQLAGRGRATSIAAGRAGRLLVGFEDGQIATLDPAALRLEPFARVKGSVVWLSDCPRRQTPTVVAAVTDSGWPSPWPGEEFEVFEARRKRFHRDPLAPLSVALVRSGRSRSWRVPSDPNSFLLDDSERLWMGTNKGEMEGDLSCIDLRTGKAHVIAEHYENVNGLLRSVDGRLLVYGGDSDQVVPGAEDGFIARVQNGALENIVASGNEMWRSRQKGPLPNAGQPGAMPNGPVELMRNDETSNGFWVVAARALHHVSADLSHWTRVVDLGGEWVQRVIAMIPSPGQGSSLIFATVRDGLIKASGETVERLRFAGQLESGYSQGIADIWQTSLGLLFLTEEGHYGWRLASGRWRKVSFLPTWPPIRPDRHWSTCRPWAAQDDGILSYCEADRYPEEGVLTKLTATGPREVRTWEKTRYCDHSDGYFMTSDGTSWHICERDLEVLESAGWRKAGAAKKFSNTRFGALSGRPYISIGKTGQAEILYHVGTGDLLQLAPQTDGTFRLDPYAFSGANPGGLSDAVADGPGRILLAAVHGLFRLDAASGRLEAIPSPEPHAKILSLCRDPQGRLWAAGDKLHLSTDNGRHWELVDLPMLSPTWKRIRPDPQNPRGMILSLYDRGVVFLE